MADRDGLFASLERRSAALFFLAGGLMVVLAALFATGRHPGEGDPLLGMVAPAGFGAAFLGLLGRTPALRARARRLAWAGAIVLVIGIAGTIVLVVGNGAQFTGVFEEKPVWVSAANLPLLVGVFFGFGVFGVGSLLTGAHSRSISLLMLWPAVVFGVVIILVGTFILGVTFPHWFHTAHSASEAVVYLSLGYLIRKTPASTDRTPSTADSPA